MAKVYGAVHQVLEGGQEIIFQRANRDSGNDIIKNEM
jgi:hypothetical protein